MQTTNYLEYARHLAPSCETIVVVVRMPTSNTASHDHHNQLMGFLFYPILGFHITQVSLIVTQVKNKIAYHSIN